MLYNQESNYGYNKQQSFCYCCYKPTTARRILRCFGLWFLVVFGLFDLFVRFLIQDFCLFHLLLAFCFLVLLHLFFKCIDVLYLQTIFRLWFILGLCFNMLLVVRLAPFFFILVILLILFDDFSHREWFI